MSSKAQMKILNLYRGQPAKKAEYALDIAMAFHRNKMLNLRVKLCGISIGECNGKD